MTHSCKQLEEYIKYTKNIHIECVCNCWIMRLEGNGVAITRTMIICYCPYCGIKLENRLVENHASVKGIDGETKTVSESDLDSDNVIEVWKDGKQVYVSDEVIGDKKNTKVVIIITEN